MEISSDNTVKDIFEGFATATIKESKEFIKSLLNKLKNKELSFIQDSQTITAVKELRKSGELTQYKSLIENKEKLQIITMGLALRRLEKSKNIERVNNLRSKIYIKYKLEGLHIAQVIQNGILSRYIINLLEQGFSSEDVKTHVNHFLENIEKHVCFVSSDQVAEQVFEEIKIKLIAHSPSIFILSGTGSAIEIISSILEEINEEKLPYIVEKYIGFNRESYFFNRII